MNLMRLAHIRKIFFLILFFFYIKGNTQALHKQYDDAERVFYKEKFKDALELFKLIQYEDEKYEDVPYKIEICLLLSDRQYEDMTKFLGYEKRMARQDKFYYYWKGRILLQQYKFEEAIQNLKRFISSSAQKSEEIISEAKKWIKWCESSKKQLDNPKFYEIHPLEKGINSKFAELSPVFFPSTKELLFLSNRENQEAFEVFHTFQISKKKWSSPVKINSFGTFIRENANIEIVEKKGKLLVYDSDNEDLFFSKQKKDLSGWQKPEKIEDNISILDIGSHFYINENENIIVFSVNNGSVKNTNYDLYHSEKNLETGNWSKPVPFSTKVDTKYNEDSPYLTPDGKTLYFSSDGHNTMGGYDVFKIEFNENTQSWGDPINLGFPINSPDDEIGFKMSTDGKSGYFTSNRLHTVGDFDIFFFWDISKISVVGKITDGKSGKPMNNAQIFFQPSQYTDMYFQAKTNANGEYAVELGDDDEYIVKLKTKDSVYHLENYRVIKEEGVSKEIIKNFVIGKPEEIKEKPQVISENTKSHNAIVQKEEERLIKSLESYDVAVVRNIFFDLGKSRIKETSLTELESLKKLLDDKPEIKLEIDGHTCDLGGHDTNMKLSLDRANEVRKWLIKKGIKSERLKSKGYGETKPLVSNDSEELREINRRIEIKVVK